MRFLPLFTSFLLAAAHGQEANTAILNLVDEGEFNKLKIDLEVILGDSSDVATLAGTITVRLNIDPETAKTDEMTIQSADVSGSDVELAAGGILGRYEFASKDLGLTAVTTEPPGLVESFIPGTDPPVQVFETDQHTFIVNKGTLGGRVVPNPFLGDPTVIEYDFANEPFEDSGTESGTILLTPAMLSDGKQFYDVEVTLPIFLSQEIETEGISLTATANLAGVVKAVGTTFVVLPLTYDEWAASQGLEEGSEKDFTLSQGVPNLFLFQLGFEAGSAPSQLLERESTGIVLKTAGRVARGDLEIQWSINLVDWVRVPDAEMVSGSSLVTEGAELETRIVAGLGSGGGPRFYRLVSATNP